MEYKKDFPFFKKNKKTIYLDSAASALKVESAINAEKDFLENLGVNVGRGMYHESLKATDAYESARKEVAKFLNSKEEEIIFTTGTTEGLNVAANALASTLTKEDNVITTIMEHNSSYLPWYEKSQEKGFELRVVALDKNFQIDFEDFKNKADKKTKVFITSIASNVLGNFIELEKIINYCKDNNIITIIDAAQGIAHKKIDVKKLKIDFLAFSGHKVFATNGIGVLYANYDVVKNLKPLKVGGDALALYDEGKPIYKKAPYLFESGTPLIAQAISLKAALEYVNRVGFDEINKRENELVKYGLEKFKEIKEVELLNKNLFTPIFSFNVKGVHSHDIAFFLAEKNIAVRAGLHCVERFLKNIGWNAGCLRASLCFYNDKKDLDKFFIGLREAINFFKKEKSE